MAGIVRLFHPETAEAALTPSPKETSYDEIPYPGGPFPQTHPDRLATLGRLFGLSPTAVTRCRVLEMGCGAGRNLIPMAFHLPESAFVGIDLSARQVEQATTTIRDLGLHNIRVENGSIMDIDRSWGRFDYILCHGVYSWVAEAVRDKILAVAAANLTPNGIAYVSYNTYPGWHLREMVRHMMQYHIAQFEGAAKRIEQARALIQFLSEAVSTDGYYGAMLKSELDLVRQSRDWYLFHDHLEEVNAPVYFHQFIDHAAGHGLQYLAEANFASMLCGGFPDDVAATLKRIGPTITRTEQYMDFLRNRFFRQTLLCNQAHVLNRNLAVGCLDGLSIASAARPREDPVNLAHGVKQSFETPSGLSFSTAFPPSKAALAVLRHHWPRAMDQVTLRRDVGRRLGVDRDISDNDWDSLRGDLLHCYSLNIVELHTWQAPIAGSIAEFPQASRLARYQCANGDPVVNQRHEQVPLDAIGSELLAILDGDHDHQMLCRHIGALLTADATQPKHADPSSVERLLRQTLAKLAAAALLLG